MRAEASEAAGSAWTATIAAALLRRGAMVHAASLVLTLSALLGTAAWSIFVASRGMGWTSAGAAIVILGIAEFWLAARVALDAELFDAIAAKGSDLDGFDRAMRVLGLMPSDNAGRALGKRVQGAFRLLKLQGLMLGLQISVFVLGTLWGAPAFGAFGA
jgi:hypothetical protein